MGSQYDDVGSGASSFIGSFTGSGSGSVAVGCIFFFFGRITVVVVVVVVVVVRFTVVDAIYNE